MVKRPAKKHLQSIPIEAMQSVSVPCDDKFHTKDSNRPHLQMQFVNSAAHDEKMVQELYWDAIKDARKGYIEPQEVITLKDAIEYAKLLLTIVIVSGFGVDGSIDAIIYASNKASFKAVKVK
jgi:hypothetical protein